MTRKLTPHSSVENLKLEARRWLKALRAGEAEARHRLHAATPAASAHPTLRDVQLALAREHGFAGWAALKIELDDLALARRSNAERADIVLRSAWGGDAVAAARILARCPDISTHDFYTAVATGNRAAVEQRLASDPAAATRKGGPLNWEPLLYVAYARLPGGGDDALAIARLLLDHGADPNAQFDDGWGNAFKVLTGVIGEGEGDRPPHADAEAFARLLIERGADPYDPQALYNTSITRDETAWLDRLWFWSQERDRLGKWRALPAPSIGGNVPMTALDYLLGNAVAYNHIRRAEWLLDHGANADGVHAYSNRPLREEALVYGHVEMADLLVRHGAKAAVLEASAAFQAACMRLDRETATRLATENPDFLREPEPMLNAARQGRADVVSLLLALGMDVDVSDGTQQRGLHNAVMGGSLDVVKLLVAHGANVDRPTTRFGGPVGFAAHFGRCDIARFLAPLSRDVFNLTSLELGDRLGELFAEEPGLVNAVAPRMGITPLFCLPDEEDAAVEMTTLLLHHGADPAFVNKEGITPAQHARQRGLIAAAELMDEG